MKGHADSRDGKITPEEWCEYYNNVSMSIDDDAYFDLMMNNTWNLDGKKVTKKGWAGEYWCFKVQKASAVSIDK